MVVFPNCCSPFVLTEQQFKEKKRTKNVPEYSVTNPIVYLGKIHPDPFLRDDGKKDKDEMVTEEANTIKIFYCYAHEDERLRKQLEKHLSFMKREGLITGWFDRDIRPGAPWASEIEANLNSANIILLLVSPDFMASEYCYSVEMKRAFERQAAGEARVIPIILRPVDWEGAPFSGLQALPTNSKPVSEWPKRDRAFLDIAQGIRTAINELIVGPEVRSVLKQSQEIWHAKAGAQTPIQDTLPRQAQKTKEQMQVCFISSEYPPHMIGGLGAHVEELTKALGERLSVDVVLPEIPSGSKEEYEIVPIVQLHKTDISASYSNVASWINFSKSAVDTILNMKIKPKVIHCHDWVTVLAGIYCRQTFRVPLLFHLHLPNRSPLCASIENLGLVYADQVTVNSKAAWAEIKNRNLNIRRIEIINNGVNVDRFKPCKDWPDDDGYILFVGRLVEQKGPAYLIRAFSYVLEKYPDLKLKIVGEGPDRSWLETLSTNLLIPINKVEFLGKKIGLELVELYQKAQMVIIPSVYEPFGMVALEAMACKRPVVASKVGGLSGIIKHKISGYLVEPKDVLGLSQYMMALIHDIELRKKMGEEGYKVAVSKDYQWSCIAEEFIRFYEELSHTPLDVTKPKGADEFRKEIRDAANRLSWGKKCEDALRVLGV